MSRCCGRTRWVAFLSAWCCSMTTRAVVADWPLNWPVSRWLFQSHLVVCLCRSEMFQRSRKWRRKRSECSKRDEVVDTRRATWVRRLSVAMVTQTLITSTLLLCGVRLSDNCLPGGRRTPAVIVQLGNPLPWFRVGKGACSCEILLLRKSFFCQLNLMWMIKIKQICPHICICTVCSQTRICVSVVTPINCSVHVSPTHIHTACLSSHLYLYCLSVLTPVSVLSICPHICTICSQTRICLSVVTPATVVSVSSHRIHTVCLSSHLWCLSVVTHVTVFSVCPHTCIYLSVSPHTCNCLSVLTPVTVCLSSHM